MQQTGQNPEHRNCHGLRDIIPIRVLVCIWFGFFDAFFVVIVVGLNTILFKKRYSRYKMSIAITINHSITPLSLRVCVCVCVCVDLFVYVSVRMCVLACVCMHMRV